MRTTAEHIKNKDYTVVWGDSISERDAALGFAVHEEHFDEQMLAYRGCLLLRVQDEIIAAALPALPRRLTKEQVSLLLLYAWHGIDIKVIREGSEEAVNLDSLLCEGWAQLSHGLHPDGSWASIAVEGNK